ncbi:hypothetical protein ACJX0J_042437, partial [Zea mays]
LNALTSHDRANVYTM